MGNTDRGRAVARRVGEHNRCFKARYQALVGIGRGIGKGVNGPCVLDDAANVEQCSFRHARVDVTGEDVSAIFGQ